MRNKTEIKKELVEMEKKIEELKGLLEGEKEEIEADEVYLLMQNNGVIAYSTWYDDIDDKARTEIGNAYKNTPKNRKKLENKIEKLKVEKILQDIADEDKACDWSNEDQAKYGLYYNYRKSLVINCSSYRLKTQGVIYSTNKNFDKIAFERIGKERLENYFKI